MKKEETIEETLVAARALADAYREMSQRVIPKTLRAAMEDGWEMDLGGMDVPLPDWFFYSQGEREEGRQRVLPLKRALALIGEMEEEILSKLIRTRAGILMRRLKRWENVLKFVGQYGDETLDAIRTGAELLWEELSGVNWGQDWGKIWDDIATAISRAGAAVAAAILAGLLLMVARIVRTGLDATGPVAWLGLCSVVMGERRQCQRSLLRAAFPQRPAKRAWRRKEVRL